MFTRPAVIFPDVEEWAVDYLTAALADREESVAEGVTVDNRVPETMPARLVTVRDDGGPRGQVTRISSIGVNVWAASPADCSDLIRLVVALLEQAPGDDAIVGHDSTSGPLRFAEESTKPHCYASVDLVVRGSAL